MVKDIILSDSGDLSFNNGDFKIGASDQQHVVLLVNTFVGSWKQNPTCGVGIMQYLCSAGQGAILERSIKVQLDADGYKNINVVARENPGGYFDYDIAAER